MIPPSFKGFVKKQKDSLVSHKTAQTDGIYGFLLHVGTPTVPSVTGSELTALLYHCFAILSIVFEKIFHTENKRGEK